MASFPTSIFAPTTKSAGDTIQPSHINDAQGEIVAVETVLINVVTNLSTSVLVGRGAGSTGSAEVITVGDGLTMTGTTLSAAGGYDYVQLQSFGS